MTILGIETSCDDTALALIETKGDLPNHGHTVSLECRVLSSLVHSQAELHSAYGGVFPTLAKREHGKNIVPLLHKLLIESRDALSEISLKNKNGSTTEKISDEMFNAKLEHFKTELQGQNPELVESISGAHFLQQIPDIDQIAVTEGPGLEPALWVGIVFARFLGDLWSIPVVPVNHMEGHIVGSLLQSDAPMGAWQKLKPFHGPALALLISGGHTELVKIPHIGSYEIIGQTKDDAVGEAFDKVARLLELPYPGGPHISKLSHEAMEENIISSIKLPRPMIASKDLNFSFSGLKTAVLYAVREEIQKNTSLSDLFKKGLAREFEEAVAETLESKLRSAIDETGAQTLIIGGGVSANHLLRMRFAKIADEYAMPLYMPTGHVSGDNALMIALASVLQRPEAQRPIRAHGTKKLGL